jgi:hypothetical protein
MTLLMNNVKPRKSLASQLDRLDRILDGFADGLNGAVAESVKDAVAVAVKEAVKEVLTSPALQQRLQEAQGAAMPAQSKKPLIRRIGLAMASLWSRTKVAVKASCDQAKVVATPGYNRAKAAVVKSALFLQAKVRALLVRIRRTIPVMVLLAKSVAAQLWRRRKAVLLAASVGAAIAVCCYFAGPMAAAMTAGMSTGGMAGVVANGMPKIACFVPRRHMVAQIANS